MSWCLRLESPIFLWVHYDHILRRLRLPESLTAQQLKVLSTSSPETPILIEVDWGAWHDGAFDGELHAIHCPPPLPYTRKKRVMAPMKV